MKSMMKRVSVVDTPKNEHAPSAASHSRGPFVAHGMNSTENSNAASAKLLPSSPAIQPASPLLSAAGDTSAKPSPALSAKAASNASAKVFPALSTQMTASASADAAVLQRRFDLLMSQFADELSPDRMAAIAALEKEVAGLNGEVDAMEAWLNSSDKLVSATKARVARLETVVSNISLAKLIERVMQPLPDPSSVSPEVFLGLEREQAAMKIQRAYYRRNARLGWNSLMVTYAMSPQSALVRTWLRLLRTIIESEASLVNDLRVLCLGFHRPFVYEVVRQNILSEKTKVQPDGSSASFQWLNNEDVDFLFGNVDTAYAVHAAFLTSLEWQFSQWPNPGWGGFAGAFRLLFKSLRSMVASFGGSPQRLSRSTYERLSMIPEFNALVQQTALTFAAQCESLPLCAGRTFVSLYSVQFSKLDQLLKNCGEWVSACDDEYFEKQELNSIVKEFESFYHKACTSKRSTVVQYDEAQIHRHNVIRLSKRFSTIQTWLFKPDHLIKFDIECNIMLSATPVSERIACHIIVSTKFFCIALREIVAESGNGNGAFDLQNVAAEALAQVSTEAPLTMIEKWDEISRIRLLEIKVESKHCLAIAVSRTHESLFRRFAPYEHKAPSASAKLRQNALMLIINAFARSLLQEGTSRFMLSTLIDWLVSTDQDEMHSMIVNINAEDNSETDPDVLISSIYTEGGIVAAKAMAIAVEMALLCIIFPVDPVDCDSSSGFSDLSAIFSVSALKHGSENVPTLAFSKRQCFCGRSSPLYENELSHCIWSGEIQTFSEGDVTGFVPTPQLAVLRRAIHCSRTEIEVQDELLIYSSKWQGTCSKCIPMNNETICRRVIFAPDGSYLPPSDCVMKLQSKDVSVSFLASLELLQKLQHTHVNIQLDDSAFVDHHGFRTSVISSVADGSDLSDFGGGWHLILPSNKEDHPKIFEALLPLVKCSYHELGSLSLLDTVVKKPKLAAVIQQISPKLLL